MNLRKSKALLILAAMILLMTSPGFSASPDRTWYVATNGKPNGAGTREDPFPDLGKARLAVRQALQENPAARYTVLLRGGLYTLKESFRLDAADSGTEQSPVTYKAYPGEKVSLCGAVRVPAGLVRPLTDSRVANRIIEAPARSHIREIDLGSLGLPDTVKWKIAGFGRPYVESGMELFINGKPYSLAGYPNQGKIKINPEDVVDPGIRDGKAYPGKIRFPGDRIKKWPVSGDAMVFGCFTYAWASDQLRVAGINPVSRGIAFADAHVYGISGKKEWNQYRIFNLLEETDQPGEYYLDNKAGKLWYYPLAEPAASDTILVSVLGAPLISISKASNIRIEGMTLEAGRGIAVSIVDGNNNCVKNCTIRNMGMLGVRTGLGYDSFGENQNNFNCHGGKDNRVENCLILNTGSGGICLGGGDRRTLDPAHNQVTDCEFTNCGRLTYSYKCPVNIHGVGNIISHCTFNESPATEIYLHGNDHLIEYNMVRDACTFMDDQGAFYLGRNPSESGTIIRYNHFQNCGRFGMTMAVYLDDGACGTSVYGNLFEKAGSRTIMMGGGSFNTMTANIFLNTPMAIHLDNRLENWAKDWVQPGGLFEKELREIRYQEPPYSVKYPGLVNYFANHPENPKGNDIAYNLFNGVGQVHNGKSEWGPVHGNNRSMQLSKGDKDNGKVGWTPDELVAIRKLIPDFRPLVAGEAGRRAR